ncbi:MAG TPA: phenylalanine--tRNA ligase subunit alpha, partial [bacterium]|nr:phenylalanine--tRNA ligase subunit alpha [bacterium]
MISRIEQLERDALAALDAATDLKGVEAVKARFLGRTDGELTALLRNLRELPAAERPAAGARANLAKTAIESRLAARLEALEKAEQDRSLSAAAVDITLPGRAPHRGSKHPLMQTMDEIIDVFVRMGFSVERGPEVESDFNNFEALNFPDHHPARDMQDTFFVGADEQGTPARIAHPHLPEKRVPMLLRTHTSPVQIRTMLRVKNPPVRMICPGAVYRHDSDQTHSPMFHQVEGLMVDRNVSMADLKGVLLEFARAMFGPKSGIR